MASYKRLTEERDEARAQTIPLRGVVNGLKAIADVDTEGGKPCRICDMGEPGKHDIWCPIPGIPAALSSKVGKYRVRKTGTVTVLEEFEVGVGGWYTMATLHEPGEVQTGNHIVAALTGCKGWVSLEWLEGKMFPHTHNQAMNACDPRCGACALDAKKRAE